VVIELLSPSATAEAAFCSFTVTDAPAIDWRVGCSFRAVDSPTANNPGEHIEVTWDIQNDRWRIFHRENDHDDSSNMGDADSTCTCTMADPVDGDILGVTFDGTVAGNDTNIKMWNFGISAGAADLADPSTWAGEQAADCECNDTEIDGSGLIWIDDNGGCGLHARYVQQDADNRPNIDDFICGDQP
jgi:hypothetical protein